MTLGLSSICGHHPAALQYHELVLSPRIVALSKIHSMKLEMYYLLQRTDPFRFGELPQPAVTRSF